MEDGMDDRARPWLAGEAPARDGRRHAPATARNSDAIATLLAALLPPDGLVLEVASGSGEHVVHFARRFPALRFQPSDPDPAALASIAAWTAQAGLANVAPPIRLDAAAPESWPLAAADALLCINMVHISPWEATLGLLAGAARLLPEGGLLYLYGPYVQRGIETAASNLAFDQSLRRRDPAWGLRRVDAVEAAASVVGLGLERVVTMPANNLSLIFRRGPRQG
jgi:SAM-dependent methyltransferase